MNASDIESIFTCSCCLESRSCPLWVHTYWPCATGYRCMSCDMLCRTSKVCRISLSKMPGYCTYCCKKLVPIGHDRSNGRDHHDWAGRKMHKKCFIEWRIYG